MNFQPTRSFGPLQLGIVLLTLATATMHFVLIFPDVLFILNALGYVTLLAALYLPLAALTPHRWLVRWLLMGYTALTIGLWLAIGQRDAYAYVNKLIEVALLGLLWVEQRRAWQSSE